MSRQAFVTAQDYPCVLEMKAGLGVGWWRWKGMCCRNPRHRLRPSVEAGQVGTRCKQCREGKMSPIVQFIACSRGVMAGRASSW